MLLELDQVDCFYSDLQVVRSASLQLQSGEVLCLLGRNGAGKTTLLKSIVGLVKKQGVIKFCGNEIGDFPAHEIPKLGVGYVPQGRRLFSELTVRENLLIGQMTRNNNNDVFENVFKLFPVLQERLEQESGTLSGGEQQMLAMARAMCIEPAVLMLDEPTEGLMPQMIANIRQAISTLKSQGVGILLVEQRVEAVLSIADRVAFIENGLIKETFDVAELSTDKSLLQKYIGI